MSAAAPSSTIIVLTRGTPRRANPVHARSAACTRAHAPQAHPHGPHAGTRVPTDTSTSGIIHLPSGTLAGIYTSMSTGVGAWITVHTYPSTSSPASPLRLPELPAQQAQ